MKKLVYLVRHAQYHNPRHIFPGRLPVALSKEGRKEAVRLQHFFKDKEIERIYSSAVMRCKQTSAIISDDKLPIIYDKRLLESFSAYQGYWGLETNPYASWDEFYSHQDELGGETYQDIQGRMVAFFNEITARPEGNIIICSHGDPLQFLYYHLSGKELPAPMQERGDLGNPEYQPKGSIRLLTVEDGQYLFDSIINQQMLQETIS